MKLSLALGPRQALSPQTAWGCLTTNLAFPGFGSLVARRPAGYPQAALGALGLILTTVFGLRFISWYIAHWSQLYGPQADPLAAMRDMWHGLRWALLGIGIFLIGWLWALATSLSVLKCSRSARVVSLPPILGS